MNIYWALYCQAMSTTAMPYVTGPDLSKGSNNPRFFVLCNSCFWCASYLRRMDTLRCPSCKTEIMESVPIRLDETFLFQCDRKRGVSLQFLIAWAVRCHNNYQKFLSYDCILCIEEWISKEGYWTVFYGINLGKYRYLDS